MTPEDRKEKIKSDKEAIGAALGIFGHKGGFSGLEYVRVGERTLSIDYGGPKAGIYLSFDISMSDAPDELSDKSDGTPFNVVGKSLQKGTKDFFDKLKLFVAKLGQAGINVEYHAEDRRSRLYAKAFRSVGFRQLPGRKTDQLKSWAPDPANLAAGSPILARLTDLEKKIKGIRDLPEPRPTKFQEADRYHSDVFGTQYAVGTASGGRSVYVWGDQTAKGRFDQGQIPKGWLEQPQAERGAVMGTPGQIAWELENCVGSFADHGDETQQAEARALVDQLLGSLGVGPEVERTPPPKFALRDLPKPAPPPGTVPSSQSAPDSPSVPTAPAPAPTAAPAGSEGTRPIRDLLGTVQTPVPAPAAVSPTTATPSIPAPTAAMETGRAARAIRALPPAPGRSGEAGRAGGAGLPGATGIPGVSWLGSGAGETGRRMDFAGAAGAAGAAGVPGIPGSPAANALSRSFSWQMTSDQREGSEQLIAAIKELTQALKEKRDDREPGIQPDGSFIPAGPNVSNKAEEKDKGMFMGPWMPGFLRGLRS